MAKKKVAPAEGVESAAVGDTTAAKRTVKKAVKKAPAAAGVASVVDTDAAARMAALMISKRNQLPMNSGKSSAFKPAAGGLPANLGGTGGVLSNLKKNEAHGSSGAIGRQQTGANQNRFIPRRTSG